METKLESKRWTLNEFTHFCLMTILSGAMIAICATSSLLANGVMKEFGKFVGAILFSLGIFVILAYDMKLFTGLVSTIPHMKLKNLWKREVNDYECKRNIFSRGRNSSINL